MKAPPIGGSIPIAHLHAPVSVLEFDLSEPSEIKVISAQAGSAASVLVRVQSQPVGVVNLPAARGLPTREAILAAVTGELSEAIRQVAEIDVATVGLSAAAHTRFTDVRAAYLPQARRIATIICTRDRPAALRRCLESLERQDHPDFGVWVVDNAPSSAGTREVVHSFGSRLEVHYLEATCPGLSKARNIAVAADIDAEHVAWIDDDEIADSMWLSEIARAFDERPAAIAVAGLVLPAELETTPQLWFEQYGGHSKGRGFAPSEFSPATRHIQHPLFPLPSFGSGANMAFKLSALRHLGGFDEALGAGTLTSGAEDTKMLSEVLMSGGTVLYRPSAVTRHFHRRDVSALARQMEGYGVGLTAYYTSLIASHPSYLWPLIRLAPSGFRELTSRSGVREASVGPDFPRELLNLHRRALLRGPGRYVRQRWRNARERRAGAPI